MGKKKKTGGKTKWNQYVLPILFLVGLFLLGFLVGRASIRMVDDPRPRIMKVKNMEDGVCEWLPDDEDRSYEVGDIIRRYQSLHPNDSTVFVTDVQNWMVINVKETK